MIFHKFVTLFPDHFPDCSCAVVPSFGFRLHLPSLKSGGLVGSMEPKVICFVYFINRMFIFNFVIKGEYRAFNADEMRGASFYAEG